MSFKSKRGILAAGAALAILTVLPWKQAQTIDTTQYWVKIKALNKFDRSVIADTGAAIEIVSDDYVVATANLQEKNRLEKLGWVIAATPLMSALDFPNADAEFHNYAEMKASIEDMLAKYPTITKAISLGKSLEGREQLGLRISGQMAKASDLPGIIFMGGHHAREHVSVEMPLRLARHILEQYAIGNLRIVNLVNSRDIHIIPAINPDGLEFDISTGRYKYWRKNRRQNADGTQGVDLNRNYSFQWGTGGSSKDGNSDVYMGPTPFSEPETQNVRDYVEKNTNIAILLSFHTFSKLILYPWGHSNDPVGNSKDRETFEAMGKKMSEWNGYTPQQSSDLYIASGDTVDWAYGTHKIFAFTFELDPANSGGAGGFYPGAGIIKDVVAKNIEPALYLIDLADNPYRASEVRVPISPIIGNP